MHSMYGAELGHQLGKITQEVSGVSIEIFQNQGEQI